MAVNKDEKPKKRARCSLCRSLDKVVALIRTLRNLIRLIVSIISRQVFVVMVCGVGSTTHATGVVIGAARSRRECPDQASQPVYQVLNLILLNFMLHLYHVIEFGNWQFITFLANKLMH
ncbi:hypothetical protein PIB30_100242 [Stylosanthes scabra]|uniref:Uncharacterized protein n=1 Tax=Stylosanthes scabra TaxID=79078 RepID=A0ABU6XYM2_9FABA|nr:hypothetical protein [Stylosanthes scabra]